MTTLILATAIVVGRSPVAADSGAVLKFKPETHEFGQVTATKDSAPLTVTVTNKSSSTITFASIAAADTFSIQSDKCSGSPLGPSKSCKVEVVFHPMVTGKVNAPNGLMFTDSAQNSPNKSSSKVRERLAVSFRPPLGKIS